METNKEIKEFFEEEKADLLEEGKLCEEEAAAALRKEYIKSLEEYQHVLEEYRKEYEAYEVEGISYGKDISEEYRKGEEYYKACVAAREAYRACK